MNRVCSPLAGFDPMAGTVILSPEAPEPGCWVGSPSVLHDGERFWLTYRQRRPRGSDHERGWRCAVAVSDDGVKFADVWAVRKDELPTPSMERFCMLPTDDGGFELFVSYVDPVDGRWRIDVLAGKDPSRFDITTREDVLTAESTGTEGVKDPYVLRVGPVTYMFVSYAAPVDGVGQAAHATGDIYNTGVTSHPTGLATSTGGRGFTWHGEVLPVGPGWNRYQARLNSVVHLQGGYVGFYDGSASHHENYEERCGIAVSSDLFNWHRLDDDQPWVISPHATGSVRYLDALIHDGHWWLYYEITRPDLAHELRLIRIPLSGDPG